MPMVAKRRAAKRRAVPATPSGAGPATKVAGISSEAVQKRTGRTWPEWVKALDAAGCRELPHKEIAEIVHARFAVGDWWSQMVTVGYEQATGLRVKHQVGGGFSGSASKTVDVPVAALYEAWSDLTARRRWMGHDGAFTVRKATKNKSMRITWVDGESSVEVNFYAKGPAKAQVAVQHSKLTSAKAAERHKAAWARRLEALKGLLEA